MRSPLMGPMSAGLPPRSGSATIAGTGGDLALPPSRSGKGVAFRSSSGLRVVQESRQASSSGEVPSSLPTGVLLTALGNRPPSSIGPGAGVTTSAGLMARSRSTQGWRQPRRGAPSTPRESGRLPHALNTLTTERAARARAGSGRDSEGPGDGGVALRLPTFGRGGEEAAGLGGEDGEEAFDPLFEREVEAVRTFLSQFVVNPFRRRRTQLEWAASANRRRWTHALAERPPTAASAASEVSLHPFTARGLDPSGDAAVFDPWEASCGALAPPWRSLTEPAILPLTTSFVPTSADLQNNFSESNYTLTPPLDPSAQTVRELLEAAASGKKADSAASATAGATRGASSASTSGTFRRKTGRWGGLGRQSRSKGPTAPPPNRTTDLSPAAQRLLDLRGRGDGLLWGPGSMPSLLADGQARCVDVPAAHMAVVRSMVELRLACDFQFVTPEEVALVGKGSPLLGRRGAEEGDSGMARLINIGAESGGGGASVPLYHLTLGHAIHVIVYNLNTSSVEVRTFYRKWGWRSTADWTQRAAGTVASLALPRTRPPPKAPPSPSHSSSATSSSAPPAPAAEVGVDAVTHSFMVWSAGARSFQPRRAAFRPSGLGGDPATAAVGTASASTSATGLNWNSIDTLLCSASQRLGSERGLKSCTLHWVLVPSRSQPAAVPPPGLARGASAPPTLQGVVQQGQAPAGVAAVGGSSGAGGGSGRDLLSPCSPALTSSNSAGTVSTCGLVTVDVAALWAYLVDGATSLVVEERSVGGGGSGGGGGGAVSPAPHGSSSGRRRIRTPERSGERPSRAWRRTEALGKFRFRGMILDAGTDVPWHSIEAQRAVVRLSLPLRTKWSSDGEGGDETPLWHPGTFPAPISDMFNWIEVSFPATYRQGHAFRVSVHWVAAWPQAVQGWLDGLTRKARQAGMLAVPAPATPLHVGTGADPAPSPDTPSHVLLPCPRGLPPVLPPPTPLAKAITWRTPSISACLPWAVVLSAGGGTLGPQHAAPPALQALARACGQAPAEAMAKPQVQNALTEGSAVPLADIAARAVLGLGQGLLARRPVGGAGPASHGHASLRPWVAAVQIPLHVTPPPDLSLALALLPGDLARKASSGALSHFDTLESLAARVQHDPTARTALLLASQDVWAWLRPWWCASSSGPSRLQLKLERFAVEACCYLPDTLLPRGRSTSRLFRSAASPPRTRPGDVGLLESKAESPASEASAGGSPAASPPQSKEGETAEEPLDARPRPPDLRLPHPKQYEEGWSRSYVQGAYTHSPKAGLPGVAVPNGAWVLHFSQAGVRWSPAATRDSAVNALLASPANHQAHHQGKGQSGSAHPHAALLDHAPADPATANVALVADRAVALSVAFEMAADILSLVFAAIKPSG